MQELAQKDYLLNLKRDIKLTEEQLKQQQKVGRLLVQEQAKKDKEVERVVNEDKSNEIQDIV